MRKQLKHLPAALSVFISRFGMLPMNFSPLGSFGFFSGNLLQFFATILLFDVFFGGLYKGFLFTYAGFAMYWLLGRVAAGSPKKQMVLLPIASFLFFIISNFGVWLGWYPATISGLIACYAAALPFYTYTFFGDMVFGYGYMAVRLLAQRNNELFTKLGEKSLTLLET